MLEQERRNIWLEDKQQQELQATIKIRRCQKYFRKLGSWDFRPA